MEKIGKYEIIDLLGKGAMGIVYKALDPDIDREVAIKTILWLWQGLSPFSGLGGFSCTKNLGISYPLQRK